jgi:hypothetical protein
MADDDAMNEREYEGPSEPGQGEAAAAAAAVAAAAAAVAAASAAVAAAGFSFPTLPVSKKIGDKTITIPASLASVHEDVLRVAAEMAINRLKTMSGQTGFVVILSLSHTAILGKIEGNGLTTDQQKSQVLKILEKSRILHRTPDAFGLKLTTVDCFKPPTGMSLHKLNFAGVGALSCVGASGDPKVPITDANYYSIILQIIHYYLTKESDSPRTFDSISKQILDHIATTFRPVLKGNDEGRVADLTLLYERIIRDKDKAAARGMTKGTKGGIHKSVKATIPLEKIGKLLVAEIQNGNLESGLGLKHHHITDADCMFNKKYMRIAKNAVEHYPALDWHITAIDINGKILVGNIADLSREDGRSTQIPAIAYEFLGESWTPDITWMMDLITAIKILAGIDIVTTKDILDVLKANGVVNVIFIDGGCNEFKDGTRSISCGQGDECLGITCLGCSERILTHAKGGGMKNKKIKKTKKKGMTVRRRMRKSYKRYKRSKTYKR